MVDINWRLPKAITIVIHNRITIKCGNKEVPKAHIVFDNDEKVLESAHKWARSLLYDDIIKDDDIEEKEDIYVVGNYEFNIKIIQLADKNLFGNIYCEIYNDDLSIDVAIEIDPELLYNLISETTFINAVCQSKVIFIKYSASLGLTTIDSKNYKLALESEKYKALIENRNTTKWELGYTYRSKFTESLYMGDVYKPVNIKYSSKNSVYTYNISNDKYHAIIQDLHYYLDDKKRISTSMLLSNCIYELNYITKFPSKSKCFYEKVDESIMTKAIKNYIRYKYNDALTANILSTEYIENTLVSLNGNITKKMISNLKRLSKVKNISNNFKNASLHIVKYNGQKFEFDDIKEVMKFIIDKLEQNNEE